MKKLILTLGIFLAGIVFVNAQDKAATKLVNKLNEICGLSQDQMAKLQPIAEDYVKSREANKQQYASDLQGLKNANKTLNKNYKAQLKYILTPDQQEKWKAYKEQQKANRKGQPEGEPESGGGQE